MRLRLNEIQQYCLKYRIAFVSYTLPGKNVPILLLPGSDGVKIYERISNIKETEGFLLSPFQSEDFPIVVISKRIQKHGWEIDLSELPKPVSNSVKYSVPYDINESEYELYAKQVDEIRKRIYAGEAKKVVLSRTKILREMDEELLPDVFEKLTKQYENAFVYLVYTPQTGIWLGATPELLLETNQSAFSTMALAATKGFHGVAKEVNWDDKELREHAYVADYVRQKLISGGYSFQELERETVRAGNVVHLRTRFQGELDGKETVWKELVELLYPTPAICGTESEATLQLIRKIEKHKREYYTGIIGPFNEKDRINLFINLRCMKISGGSALLYAGGGILGESTPAKEWKETEMKLNTLINVIQKVKGKMKTSE